MARYCYLWVAHLTVPGGYSPSHSKLHAANKNMDSTLSTGDIALRNPGLPANELFGSVTAVFTKIAAGQATPEDYARYMSLWDERIRYNDARSRARLADRQSVGADQASGRSAGKSLLSGSARQVRFRPPRLAA